MDVEPQARTISEALGLAFKAYFDGYEASGNREPTKTEQEILESINCHWLKHDGTEFKCLELFHKKKKPQSLGKDSTKIIDGCASCKDGKDEQEHEQARKILRGRTLKGYLQIIKVLDKFARSGVSGTVTFCNRLDPPIGTGMNKITCSKYNQAVEIDKVCKVPPCEFHEQYPIQMESEFPKKALAQIQGIVDDYKRLENSFPKKHVNVEQVDPYVESP